LSSFHSYDQKLIIKKKLLNLWVNKISITTPAKLEILRNLNNIQKNIYLDTPEPNILIKLTQQTILFIYGISF